MILVPLENGNPDIALGRVRELLKVILLRRSKDAILDGKPIIILPKRNVKMDQQPFAPEELEFYKALEKKERLKFNKYVKAGTVMQNYTAVLVILLRLRQACCHPKLLDKCFETAPLDQDNEHVQLVLTGLKSEVKSRLYNSDFKQTECPICCDMLSSAAFIRSCGHLYCLECIIVYMNTSSIVACPMCRVPFSEPDIISAYGALKVLI